MGSHTESVGGNTVEAQVPIDEVENTNMEEILGAVNTIDQVIQQLVEVENAPMSQSDPPEVINAGATEMTYFFPPEDLRWLTCKSRIILHT
eukprot:6241987-Amphidinium_carterae.1